MRVGEINFLSVIETGYIVGHGYFGQVNEIGRRLTVVNLILDDQSIIHFFKTFHVSGNIVFQVLNAADLEDHVLVYCISKACLTLCFDIR